MLSEAHAAEQFRDRLNDAVRIHLRSDVPVGSCLSGGLDSSSLVCLMAQMMASQNSAHRVETVSACYPGETVDERQFMDATIERAHTIPHFVYPRAEDVFTRASDITWHQDEPFGSTSIFAQWCVFEEAKRAGLKVMLDGHGADEQGKLAWSVFTDAGVNLQQGALPIAKIERVLNAIAQGKLLLRVEVARPQFLHGERQPVAARWNR